MTSQTDLAEPHLFIPLARETVDLLGSESDPIVCIQKVVWMKRWVEDVLDEYVSDSRSAGYGWDAIAAALGVTRQAAWQRYRSDDVEERRRTGPTDDYLTAAIIWSILVRRMSVGRWYDLRGVYDLVTASATISDADLEPDAPGSNSPRWQRNVRNVLQRRKASGDIEWDGRAKYRVV